ncbi:hypothetical protein [Neorhodopirellula lusitana]|uniref:hypothetical protein n=1 Tax=Neorhodopirellula lusitana TaxID=445327 RepID=UPI003850D4BD
MAFLASMGCSTDDSHTTTATGNVTCKGQPLSGVMITLQPIAPTTGPKASAPVFSGKFDFDKTTGLHGGSYRVRFSLMPTKIRKTIPVEHATGLPPDNAVIGDQYDERSNLTWELSVNQPNEKNFEIELR